MKKLALAVLFIAAFIALVGWYIAGEKQGPVIKDVNSFDECAAAGYPIAESYPEQCITPDGRSFTKIY